ncbi:UxaA family hydrolase [Caldinitratiruptor microaerophilus]|uniref:Altronate hydrolase n=1 Tax=Caldinitratiruptor microaerophilus TaxID=671077 RepID=A0AA35G9D7_9FIRM|nr:UxaA family hydrolase [Caldinitratiruptor microaerophilus]BDG60184.1 altronate hydrolase [Caldinitratiruptor microaerophilus]
MEPRRFVIMKPGKDNVATALRDLAAGTEVDLGGQIIRLLDPIPFGHKFALRDIAAGEPVYKYGQVIGKASRPIRAGEHAHVHNIESNRGRGDLAASGG